MDPAQNDPSQPTHTEGIATLLGNPKKAIIKLSVPMIIALSVQTIYNFVDALWVAGLGADALSAVGFFFPFFILIMALANGVGVGGGSAVSRRIGAHDKTGAEKVAAHTMVLMLMVCIVVTVPFIIFIEAIFRKMGAGDIAPVAASYSRILFAGAIVIFFSNNAGALLRAEGDVKRAMFAMMLGAGLNIILDPIFIYTFKLGVPGAAWATLISLTVTGCMLFYWLCLRKDTYVTVTMRNFRFDRHIIYDILRVGLPSSMQQMSMALSVFFLNMIVVRAGGTDGIAVYTTGWRVAMFAILPSIGIATAVTSVSGAAYGGRDYAKLGIAHGYAVKIGIVIELGIAALTYLLAPQITQVFTRTQEAARIAHDLVVFLRILFVFYPMIALGMLSSAMFQGVGKGIYSLTVTIARTILFVVPIAYLLALIMNIGLPGVWWGLVIGNSMGTILAFTWARLYIKHLGARY